MRHVSTRLAATALLALLTGCAMCAHPYDYTGPVIPNEPGRGMLGFDDRAGSILSGTTDTAVFEGEVFEEAVPEGAVSGEPTLAPEIQPQSVGYTSLRPTRQVLR